MKSEKEIKVKCEKCEYEWETKSKMIKVSCPSCGNKVKIRDIDKIKMEMEK